MSSDQAPWFHVAILFAIMAYFASYHVAWPFAVELARHAKREVMWRAAYAGGWVMVVTDYMDQLPSICNRRVGGIDDENPNRLSESAFVQYHQCRGVVAGFQYHDDLFVIYCIAFVVLFAAYKVLPPVATFVAYCGVGKRSSELEQQEREDALDKARKAGIDSVEADHKATVDKLQLVIKRLESKAVHCEREHDYIDAIKARSFYNENQILRKTLERRASDINTLQYDNQFLTARIEDLKRSDVTGLQRQLALQKTSQPCRDAEHSSQASQIAVLKKELEKARGASKVEAKKDRVEENDLAVLKAQLEDAQGALREETRKHQSTIISHAKELIEANTSKDLAETALRAVESSKAATVSEGLATDLVTEVEELRAWKQLHASTVQQRDKELDNLRSFKESAIKEGADCVAELKSLTQWKLNAIQELFARDDQLSSQAETSRQEHEAAATELQNQRAKFERDLGIMAEKMASEQKRWEEQLEELTRTAEFKIEQLKRQTATEVGKQLKLSALNSELQGKIEALMTAIPASTAEEAQMDYDDPSLHDRSYTAEDEMDDSWNPYEPLNEDMAAFEKEMTAELEKGLEKDLDKDILFKLRPIALPRMPGMAASGSGGGRSARRPRDLFPIPSDLDTARSRKRGATDELDDSDPHLSKRSMVESPCDADGGSKAHRHDPSQRAVDLEIAKFVAMGQDAFE